MATTTAEENERLARRVPEEIATEGRTDLVEEVYAEDAVEHLPFDESVGRDAVSEGLDQFLSAFDDFEAEVEDAVADEETVAMRVTLRGTHEGEFMGIEPTGKSFEIPNMVFTRVEDGKIAERWVLPDLLSLLQQLGVDEVPQRPQ